VPGAPSRVRTNPPLFQRNGSRALELKTIYQLLQFLIYYSLLNLIYLYNIQFHIFTYTQLTVKRFWNFTVTFGYIYILKKKMYLMVCFSITHSCCFLVVFFFQENFLRNIPSTTTIYHWQVGVGCWRSIRVDHACSLYEQLHVLLVTMHARYMSSYMYYWFWERKAVYYNVTC
jgi:hypothetical protein